MPSADAELDANGLLDSPVSIQVGHVHNGCLSGAKHPIHFPHVLSVCINQDAAQGWRGPGEGYQEPTFVTSSFHGAVEHSHHLLPLGSEVPFRVPVAEACSGAD